MDANNKNTKDLEPHQGEEENDIPQLDDGGGDIPHKEAMSDGSSGVVKKEGVWFAERRGSSRTSLRNVRDNRNGIDADFLISHLGRFIEEGRLLRDLALFIPFIVMFSFYFLAGRSVTQSHYAISAIRDTLMDNEFPTIDSQVADLKAVLASGGEIDIAPDKTYEDISNLEDWSNWLDSTIDYMWDCGRNDNVTDTAADDLRKIRPQAFAGQLYPLGALRIRTQRVTNQSCTPNSAFYEQTTNAACYGSHSKTEQKEPICNLPNPLNPSEPLFKWHSCSDVPGVPTTGLLGIYDCGGYIVEIPFDLSCTNAREYLTLMKEPGCQFLDDVATRFIIYELFFYAPNLDFYYSAKLITEVAPGGAVLLSAQLRAFSVWTSKTTGQTVFNFFFLAVGLVLWLKFIGDWGYDAARTGSRFHFFTSMWNVMELVNLSVLMASFILNWVWWARSRSSARSLPFTAYPKDLDALLYLYSQQIYLNSVNTIITFIKILKYAQLNPRLNVLSRTLSEAKENMVGLIVLFVLVVTAYAITGFGLFGPTMWEFRSVDASYGALIRMMVGSFDYDAMKETEPVLAGLYFWTYMILSNFLLLNFIVAVVCEGFTNVNQEVASGSIAEDMLRWLLGWGRSLAPSNMKRKFGLWRRGMSDMYLATVILNYLVEHRNMLLLEHADSLHVYPDDFKAFLPVEVYEHAEGFVAVHWVDFLHEFSLHERSDANQDSQDFEDSVAEGADNTIVRAASSFVSFSQKVAAFEELARDVNKKLAASA
eukprot:PhM_4_TR3225/c0_g1_i1/m.45012